MQHPLVPVATLQERTSTVAAQLRERLLPIVVEIAGVRMRPAALARGLSIDRTLAARVVRAMRAEDHVTFMQEIPAPGGLRILLDAARAVVGDEACDEAGESVQLFSRLIDEFPGGRVALDAAMSGLDDRMLQRNVRTASQAVHKWMAAILGYQADAMLTTIVMSPGADGQTTDHMYLLGKYGVRRLRASSPITVFGRRGDVSSDERPGYRVETLDGQVEPENGNAYLLTEFCTKPVPPLSLYRTERANLYTISENVPAVNSPVSLVAGQIVRASSMRYAGEGAGYQWESQVPRMPCRVLVNDLFVHEDLVFKPPVVTATLHTIADGPHRPDAPAFRLDNVDVRPTLTPLGRGLEGTTNPDIPRYGELLSSAFARAGWDPSKYVGYRCRVTYPIPLVSVTVWFEMPPAPGGKEMTA